MSFEFPTSSWFLSDRTSPSGSCLELTIVSHDFRVGKLRLSINRQVKKSKEGGCESKFISEPQITALHTAYCKMHNERKAKRNWHNFEPPHYSDVKNKKRILFKMTASRHYLEGSKARTPAAQRRRETSPTVKSSYPKDNSFS